jgi:two-component system, NarL family, sensor histidine kinase LiaS
VKSQFGLRSRMAVSYVIVSAAAVLLVEAALLVAALPSLRSADQVTQQAQDRAAQAERDLAKVTVQSLARALAASAGKAASNKANSDPARTDTALLAEAATEGLRERAGAGPPSVQVVAALDGRVVAQTQPGYAANTSLPPEARTTALREGQTNGAGGLVYWATAPIQVTTRNGSARPIGIAYVELDLKSAAAGATATDKPTDVPSPIRTFTSLVVPGLVVLLLLVPVGALFGLLSTGRLIRRIRQLSEGTSKMAGGDLQVRVPVSTGDEVGRLEQAFNTMAERLEQAVAEQRAAAGAEARRAERGRIARELHDSISQELFSVSLVAAGLRKALSPGTVLRAEAELMERSLERTMREMRALLLELRPVELEDAGLAEALEQLCRAYETRLGIPITTSLDPVPLDAAAEHAVLRVVQEAVGNAVRHGEPSAIELRLAAVDRRVEASVRDNGRGFDPHSVSERHGMGLDLMRERLREVGGVVEVDSAPERGTTIRVTLPAEQHAG